MKSAAVPDDQTGQVAGLGIAQAGEDLQAAALFAAGERGVALAAVEGGDDVEHLRRPSGSRPAEAQRRSHRPAGYARASIRRLSTIDQPPRLQST